MYVDARLAHWLLGSLSWFTFRTSMKIAAAMAKAATENARTAIRKTKGTYAFLRSKR